MVNTISLTLKNGNIRPSERFICNYVPLIIWIDGIIWIASKFIKKFEINRITKYNPKHELNYKVKLKLNYKLHENNPRNKRKYIIEI